MESRLLVYTRTKHIDYRLICKPEDEFCPKEVINVFITQGRGLMNTDDYHGELEKPRWLYSKIGKFHLWGISCLNKILNIEYGQDYTGTNIRGFIGIIYKTEQIDEIPFDVNFFRNVYCNLISKIWDDKNSNAIVGENTINTDAYNFISLSTQKLDVNTHKSICKIFHQGTNIEDLISSILSFRSDISLAIGLDDISHASSSKYGYMNAIVHGNELDRTIEIKYSMQSPKESKHKDTDAFDSTSESKSHTNQKTFSKATNRDFQLYGFANEKDIPIKKEEIGQTIKDEVEKKKESTKGERKSLNREKIMATNCNSLEKNNFPYSIEMIEKMGENNEYDELIINDIQEIIPGKQIPEKYKEMLSELKSSISSIDNYNISSEKYIEIEVLVKELIAKIKS